MTRLKKIAEAEIGEKNKPFSSKDEAIAEAKKRKSEVDNDETDATVDYIVYTPDEGETYEVTSVVDNENPGMPADAIVFCTCDN